MIITSIFVENQVDGRFSYGGALYFEDECTAILLNCTFQDNCTDLIFSISSSNDHKELLVYADGPCKYAPLSQRIIQITFLPCTCSIGFQHNEGERTRCVCECDSNLSEYITDCNPQDQTLTRMKIFWLTNVNAFSNCYLIFPNCPLNYCQPPSANIKINLNIQNGADVQCANGRCGIKNMWNLQTWS